MAGTAGGGRTLTPGSRRTLPRNDALALAISTLPDLTVGEGVEIDLRHSGVPVGLRRAYRTAQEDWYELEDGRGSGFAAAPAVEKWWRDLIEEVEELRPGATHATVRRRPNE